MAVMSGRARQSSAEGDRIRGGGGRKVDRNGGYKSVYIDAYKCLGSG